MAFDTSCGALHRPVWAAERARRGSLQLLPQRRCEPLSLSLPSLPKCMCCRVWGPRRGIQHLCNPTLHTLSPAYLGNAGGQLPPGGQQARAAQAGHAALPAQQVPPAAAGPGQCARGHAAAPGPPVAQAAGQAAAVLPAQRPAGACPLRSPLRCPLRCNTCPLRCRPLPCSMAAREGVQQQAMRQRMLTVHASMGMASYHKAVVGICGCMLAWPDMVPPPLRCSKWCTAPAWTSDRSGWWWSRSLSPASPSSATRCGRAE